MYLGRHRQTDSSHPVTFILRYQSSVKALEETSTESCESCGHQKSLKPHMDL